MSFLNIEKWRKKVYSNAQCSTFALGFRVNLLCSFLNIEKYLLRIGVNLLCHF